MHTAKVKFDIQVSKASITRPGNVTAYSDGDVVSGAGNERFVFEAVSSGRDAKSGILLSAIIRSSQAAATPLEGELYLFNQDPGGAVADNTAATFTDSQLDALLGIVTFPSASWSKTNGKAVCSIDKLNLPYRGDGTLYGVLIARNTYAPTNGEALSINLTVARD
jgi:hypothetical protein